MLRRTCAKKNRNLDVTIIYDSPLGFVSHVDRVLSVVTRVNTKAAIITSINSKGGYGKMKFKNVYALGDRVILAPIKTSDEVVLDSGIVIAKSEYQKDNEEWENDLCQVISSNLSFNESEFEIGSLVLATRDLCKKGHKMEIDGVMRDVWIATKQHIYAEVELLEADMNYVDLPWKR